MRKLPVLIVASLFALGPAGLAVAQQPQPSGETKAEEKADKAKKPAAKSARGTVKSASADSVVVTGKEKGKETEWTFAVDAKTKVRKAGKEVMAADLKAGDPVQIRYVEQDGKPVAQAITVQAPRAKTNPCAAKPAEKSK